MPVCLYSTNPWFKFDLQERHFGGIHYVWCSEHYNTKAAPPLSPHALTGPTSNPADILRELGEAVRLNDRHATKVKELRASVKRRAIQWHRDGHIDDAAKEEIVWQCGRGSITLWRPLLYVIPRATVVGRMRPVPAGKRASVGPEYIVPDLRRAEFDILEL